MLGLKLNHDSKRGTWKQHIGKPGTQRDRMDHFRIMYLCMYVGVCMYMYVCVRMDGWMDVRGVGVYMYISTCMENHDTTLFSM